MTTTESKNGLGGYEAAKQRSEPKEPPMTKTQDELDKAIEEVEALVLTYAGNTEFDAFRLILAALRSPDPEVERLREALRDVDACSQHSYGFSDLSMRRRCGMIARAALSTNSGGR